MIFLFEAEKDAYVSNRKTSTSNDNLSNVGRAATIDLFKLYNENENVFSQGKLKLVNLANSPPQNLDTFTLIDTDQNEVIFVPKSGAEVRIIGSKNDKKIKELIFKIKVGK